MTEAAGALTPEDPLVALLREAGIDKTAIIDDAYDPPSREELANEINDFLDAVVRVPNLLAKVRELKPGVADPLDVDDALVRELWEQRDALSDLRSLLRDVLFPTRLANLAPLERLSAHLRKVGLTPLHLGSQEELPQEPIKLVFIDYYLGPGVGSGPVNTATQRAAEIYRGTAEDANKPFIVLMSSKPDADAAKDNFREASGLLGGLFGYVPKEDLEDKERLYLHLATWAIDMPTRHEIQHFVEALAAASNSASEEFVRRVRALGFEDDVNIQWLSLQPEGHPLGDYMLAVQVPPRLSTPRQPAGARATEETGRDGLRTV